MSRIIANSCVSLLLTLALSQFSLGQEGDVHTQVLDALVAVTAEAAGMEGTDSAGQPLSSLTSGFFVSRSGQIVTSAHLLSELGQYDPATLQLKVMLSPKYGRQIQTAFVDGVDIYHDLLLLVTPEIPGQSFAYLRYAEDARNRVQLANTKVYTSSYSAQIPGTSQLPYKVDSGLVNAFNGPAQFAFLWVTNMMFASGQSGSPIYLDDASVVGVVKGTDRDSPNHNYIVPVSYFREWMVSQTRTSIFKQADKGRLQVIASIPTKKKEVRDRQQLFQEQNDYCQPPRDITWRIMAGNGWTIDPQSISTEVVQSSIYSRFLGVGEVHSSGFTLSGQLRNNGECISIFNRTLAKDGRGLLGVSVKYKEAREVDTASSVTVLEKNVGPGEFSLQLPADAQSYAVNLQQPSGENFHLTGSGAIGPIKVVENSEGMPGKTLSISVK